MTVIIFIFPEAGNYGHCLVYAASIKFIFVVKTYN